jgi:hypothetical protein
MISMSPEVPPAMPMDVTVDSEVGEKPTGGEEPAGSEEPAGGAPATKSRDRGRRWALSPTDTPSPTVSRKSSREGTRSPSPDPPPSPLLRRPLQRSRTPELPAGYELMPLMEEFLGTLPTDERREHMYLLARLPLGEFTRENALVRNKILLERLKIDQAFRRILGPEQLAKVAKPVVRPRPRPANKSAATEPRRKSSRLAGRTEDSEEVGGEDGRDGEGGEARSEA